MSYTNTINSTRTPAHHITGFSDPSSNKYANAQGTGITGEVLKKVANFIGMNDVSAQKPSAPGYLSADLELELSARHSAFKGTASLESEELARRTDDYFASLTGKVVSHRIADMIQEWSASGTELRESSDRAESRRFIKHVHEEMNEIERSERDRRLDDSIGEQLKQSLALKLCAAVGNDIELPHLKHAVPAGPIQQKLDRAAGVASEAASSVLGSFYQIGNFARRAAYFFGAKAAAKAQVLEQEAVAKAPVLLEEANKTAALLGDQAVTAAVVVGEKAGGALQQGVTLKLKAVALANQWIDGASKATQQATEAATELGKSAQEAIADGKAALEEALFEPTLNWSHVSTMEEAERLDRIKDGLSASRFMLAMNTSALVAAHHGDCAYQQRSYGISVLEEMERARRLAQDRSCATARLNAKRAAGAIMAHRRQTLCKQNAQLKAQERFEHVKATSPQPVKAVHFAAVAQPKRAVPQVASKRYDYGRESSHDNLLPSQQGRAAM